MARGSRMIRIANAPVSYGVFELSLPDAVPLPSGDELARHVRDGGYDGIDLGPSGLLGHGPDLAPPPRRFELALAGGWIDLPFSAGDEEFAAALAGLGGILDDFVAASEVFPDSPPKPTIADSGSAERKAHPGGAPELELDGDRWHRFAERIRTVHGLVAERGLEPTFHHH